MPTQYLTQEYRSWPPCSTRQWVRPQHLAGSRKLSRRKRPGHAETDDVDRDGEPATRGGAEVPRNIVPGAAASHASYAASDCPRRPITGRAVVVAMPAIRRPLPRIAGHVVQAERVRRVAPGRRRVGVSVVTSRHRPCNRQGHSLEAVPGLLIATIGVPAQILFVVAEPEAWIHAR